MIACWYSSVAPTVIHISTTGTLVYHPLFKGQAKYKPQLRSDTVPWPLSLVSHILQIFLQHQTTSPSMRLPLSALAAVSKSSNFVVEKTASILARSSKDFIPQVQ